MSRDTHTPRVDPDGVRVFPSGRARRATRARVALVGLVIGAVGVVTVSLWRGEPASGPAPGAAPDVAAPVVDGGRLESRAVPAPAGRPTRREARAVRVDRPGAVRVPAPVPAGGSAVQARRAAAEKRKHRQMEELARDVIDALVAAGETEGIAAFPPPGTDPIKPGLVVPEAFEVPEGYVRHYQITDDGEQLEAILMFSPDYEFLDANGRPIELPEDRIVPADMAPPAMPLRILEIPANPYGAGSGRRGRDR